jgi:GGDEF domain-containing protein
MNSASAKLAGPALSARPEDTSHCRSRRADAATYRAKQAGRNAVVGIDS